MKGMTKLLLGAAFVFGVTGGAFCIASLCLGFRGSDFAQVVQSGSSYAAINSSGSDFSQLMADDIGFEQSYRGIDGLDLNVSGMECRLIPWEREEWKVTGYRLPSDFKCRESDGTLKIKSGGSLHLLFWNPQEKTSCLEIMFPQNAVLDIFEVDSGVGDILMEDGTLICGESDIDCGIGNCTLCVDVRDELKLDCGVGDVSLLLAGAETDFDYSLDCGVGDITVSKGVRTMTADQGTDDRSQEESEHAVSGAKQKVDHDADRRIKVSCGVGSVTLAFTEE